MSPSEISLPAPTWTAVPMRAKIDDWHVEALADPATQFLVARGTAHLLRLEPEASIAFVTAEHPLVRAANTQQLVLLGWFRDARVVLLELEPDNEILAPPPHARFEELRPVAMRCRPKMLDC